MLVNAKRMEKSISEQPLTNFGLPLVFFFILIEEKVKIENKKIDLQDRSREEGSK